jgi:poly(A) polymerase
VVATSLEDYARFICRRLRLNGYEALLVGGCVRDLLLGHRPKDYDIATDASPDGVLRLFPEADRVGAHFGVVLVRDAQFQVEVATFRSDAQYSDGRRPDAVRFVSDPKQDAERRDFTINALFLDPETDLVLDFVGGRADLSARLIRAIGDPAARFEEDHLRLLRAVRFAARLRFDIEPRTFEAIQRMASLVRLVAAERIREEMTRILVEAARGVQLLLQTGLLAQIVPELVWTTELQTRFERAAHLNPIVAWAALLLDLGPSAAADVANRLRFSVRDRDALAGLVRSRSAMREIEQMPVASRKRLMRNPQFADYLTLHQLCGDHEPELPVYTDAELHPPPLLTGLDLIELGYPQGPLYSRILSAVEDAQLEGLLDSREDAVRWIRERF